MIAIEFDVRPSPLSLSHFTRVESKENLFLSAEGKAHSGEKAISSGEKFFTTPPRAAVPSAFLLHSNRKALDALARYLRQTKALFRPSHTHTHAYTYSQISFMRPEPAGQFFLYALPSSFLCVSLSVPPHHSEVTKSPSPSPLRLVAISASVFSWRDFSSRIRKASPPIRIRRFPYLYKPPSRESNPRTKCNPNYWYEPLPHCVHRVYTLLG